jgi:hypothetical protein
MLMNTPVKYLYLFVHCDVQHILRCVFALFFFVDNFRSLTNNTFQYKFHLWLSGLLNRTIEPDIRVLNHILLTLGSDHDEQKTKHAYKFFR